MTERDDPKSLSKERFGRFADGYVASAAHAKGADLARLLAIARPRRDWTVLDVATGGGHTALLFAPHVARVVASDLTPDMLKAAGRFFAERGATHVEVRQADAEDLPFDDASFDLVTCRIAPHHFPHCERFVREAARVLRAGGLLLVQDQLVPDEEAAARAVDAFERMRDPSHHRAYARSEWLAMFEAAGLRVEHTEQLTKRHELIPWARRQGNDDAAIAQLARAMDAALDEARAWMDPRDWGTPTASFVNHHLIVAGRKPA